MLFLSDVVKIWVFLIDIRKNPQYAISWKSVRWEPKCPLLKCGRIWRKQYLLFELFLERTYKERTVQKHVLAINVLLFPLVHNFNTLETYKIV